ncbi:MAG: hypothetical protein ACLF0G_02385 [Candidatus Brocadiia bacterium]
MRLLAVAAVAMATTGSATAQQFPWKTDPAKIPDSDYVTVCPEGHLETGGRRVRFWGHIGHFPNPNLKARTPEQCRRDAELMVQRMQALGFNLHRLWHGPKGPFTKGDNSRDDLRAYGVYLLKKHDIRIWFAQLNDLGTVDPDRDVAMVDDPDTAEAWQQAIEAMARTSWRWKGRKTPLRSNLAQHWDPRLGALVLQHMREIATRTNPYTGLRYCDDPNVAVWELSNEEWWLPKMTRGEWLKLPRFFQAQLIARWHAYLRRKYGSDEELEAAWGFLLPGESLAERTVMLAPTAKSVEVARLNDPNPHTQAALEGGADQAVGRDDVTAARAMDVIEFFMSLLLESKAEQARMVKVLGKSTKLAPLCWDTGTGWQIQCQYLHQQADAVAHCTYVNGKHHDRTHKRFPFNSALEELPRLCWDKPWLEHNRTPGKPFFVYETQIKSSTKYRAEFPYEIAALGSLQDWDIVNWHSYGPGPDSTKARPHVRALEVGHSMDLHYGGDEVQLSAMKAASAIFRNFLLPPASNPTWFVSGRRMLYHPDSMDYSGSYGAMGDCFLPTTYRHGMRLLIDPELDRQRAHPLFERKRRDQFGKARNEEERTEQLERVYRDFLRKGYMTIGPVARPRVFEPSPIRPTSEITYDWQRGHLKLDAPGVAGFVGFYGDLPDPSAGVTFAKTGVRLTDVKVVNPPDMPYPVTPDERYIAFSLASADGQPLATCKRALLSLVSTSFNTGFALDTSEEADIREFHGAQVARGRRGRLPVLVARVDAMVECGAIDGMSYRLYDYEMNEIGGGTVGGATLRLPADKPFFLVALQRK